MYLPVPAIVTLKGEAKKNYKTFFGTSNDNLLHTRLINSTQSHFQYILLCTITQLALRAQSVFIKYPSN